jgi:hypothetical protein
MPSQHAEVQILSWPTGEASRWARARGIVAAIGRSGWQLSGEVGREAMAPVADVPSRLSAKALTIDLPRLALG